MLQALPDEEKLKWMNPFTCAGPDGIVETACRFLWNIIFLVRAT